MAYSARPAFERRSGIQIDADDDEEDDQRARDDVQPERALDHPGQPTRRPATRGGQDDECRAGPHERHGQRHDDVGHAGDDDQRPVDDAEDEAQDEHADDHRDRERLRLALHQDGGGHARQGHHRADGQVDATGDDDDGLGDGRNASGMAPTARPWSCAAP